MDPALINEIKSTNGIIDAIGDEINFSDERYTTIKFSEKNFHKIRPEAIDKKMAFVDGGNCELIKTPNMSVQLIRASYVIFQKNKKIMQKRIECFLVAKYLPKKEAFSIKLFPDLFGEEIFLSSFDQTIKEGNHRASISKMGDVARRFLEIQIANDALKNLKSGDILVRDGTLQTTVTGEARFLSELYRFASEKEIVICALAKTCTLLTKRGHSAIAAISSIAPDETFAYYPLCESNHPDHLADMSFVKLHNKSKYIFRFEIYKKSNYNIYELISMLAKNSNDVKLVGYPYGLILADRLAKVEEKEAAVYRTKILAKCGKELESSINSMNAHDYF